MTSTALRSRGTFNRKPALLRRLVFISRYRVISSGCTYSSSVATPVRGQLGLLHPGVQVLLSDQSMITTMMVAVIVPVPPFGQRHSFSSGTPPICFFLPASPISVAGQAYSQVRQVSKEL